MFKRLFWLFANKFKFKCRITRIRLIFTAIADHHYQEPKTGRNWHFLMNKEVIGQVHLSFSSMEAFSMKISKIHTLTYSKNIVVLSILFNANWTVFKCLIDKWTRWAMMRHYKKMLASKDSNRWSVFSLQVGHEFDIVNMSLIWYTKSDEFAFPPYV